MKRNSSPHRFTWLPASLLLLLATACADNDNTLLNAERSRGAVTITIAPETLSIATRADADGDGGGISYPKPTHACISDGTKADLLIYAVYKVTEADGNKTLTLADEFGSDGTETYTLNDGTTTLTVPKGQTYVQITDQTKWPYKFQLSIEDENDRFQIAFWLQSSERMEAYDTQDLTKVKVNYARTQTTTAGDGDPAGVSDVATTELFANNDELRDAFCAVSGIVHANMEANEVVILRRPFAQVNVGTSGWDYEGAAILDPAPVTYTQSTITLMGVAQYYDVTLGKALASNDLATHGITDDGASATTDVKFAYAPLPAFLHLGTANNALSSVAYTPIDGEEVLKVDLPEHDKQIEPYYGWAEIKARKAEATADAPFELPKTETFKYLSMCYVLVPEAKALDNEAPAATNGAVLSSVEFAFKGEGEDATEFKKTIMNVPVQKNWRTNILSNDLFTYSVEAYIDIVSDYCGDYNYQDESPLEKTWPQVTYAVYFEKEDPSEKGSASQSKTETKLDEDGKTQTTTKTEGVNYFYFTGFSDDSYSTSFDSWEYDQNTGTVGLTLSEGQKITFTTTHTPATLVVVQSAKNGSATCDKGIRFDGKDYPIGKASTGDDDNTRVHTITNIKVGEHTIEMDQTDGTTTQTGIFYIQVTEVHEDTVYGDQDKGSTDDFYKDNKSQPSTPDQEE